MDMQRLIHPIILSGGTGTRLWPMSRRAFPKQFLALHSERTLIQETALRVSQEAFSAPLFICNDEHRFIVAEQLREAGIKSRRIILEPSGRNTAPAAAIAALLLAREDENSIMMLLPSDHIVADGDRFMAAVAAALPAVAEGALATFGILPHRPETGYGYIERGAALQGMANCFRIARFLEKPDADTAARLVAGGRHLWNSGMFLFTARRYLEELSIHHAELIERCREALDGGREDLEFLRLAEAPFEACESISIDNAVMEKTHSGVVIPSEMGWSDVGAWSALWELGEKGKDGNVLQGDVVVEDSTNCYIRSEKGLVAAVGVTDLVVVVTDDAVLVGRRNGAADIKAIVRRLDENKRQEHIVHSKVYRPWGSYQCIDAGSRFQVKQIIVKPGAKLSVQMHHHRAEHWVVVQGTARVHRDGESFLVTENQSTYIPLGVTHSLENPGKVPLRLIEVQSGAYLGEDDIVRFEDQYGRC